MIQRNPVKITIENLRLRTIIGINDWERDTKQDVVVNVELELERGTVFARDTIDETVDYKKLNKRIIDEVEQSSFFLIEKLCDHLLVLVMEDHRVERARGPRGQAGRAPLYRVRFRGMLGGKGGGDRMNRAVIGVGSKHRARDPSAQGPGTARRTACDRRRIAVGGDEPGRLPPPTGFHQRRPVAGGPGSTASV